MDIIETVEDQDKLITRNSIKYLNSLTTIKELNVPTLKSLYRTKCRLMELRRHIYLPPEKPNGRCHKCFMNFSEGQTKYEVRPVKLTPFAKKIIRKLRNKRVLTKFQRKYHKKLKKKFPNGFEKQNKMVITCSFCQKELEIRMKKPKVPQKVKKNTITPKKKKKSKKDKYCGLNENAVNLSCSKKINKNNKITIGDKKISTSPAKKSISTKYNNNPLNESASMTNTRFVETADFIPLELNNQKGRKIKFSNKNNNDVILPIQTISKAKEKAQKKNMKNLSNLLSKASGNNRQTSALKQFLAGL